VLKGSRNIALSEGWVASLDCFHQSGIWVVIDDDNFSFFFLFLSFRLREQNFHALLGFLLEQKT